MEEERNLDMKNRHSALRISILPALVLLAVMVFAGCSGENSTIAPDVPELDVSAIAVDPLDNALDSTDGCTPEGPMARIDRIAEILGLDEAQKEALLAAYTEFREGIVDLRDLVQAGDMTIEEAREAAAILREDFEAELQVILTPEQYDMLQDMRRFRHRNETGECDKYQRWDAWLTEVGADSAQTVAVFEALDVLHDGIRELTALVQDGTLTREEAVEAAKVLREEFDAALQSILTPEQYEALLELRPDKCKK